MLPQSGFGEGEMVVFAERISSRLHGWI